MGDTFIEDVIDPQSPYRVHDAPLFWQGLCWTSKPGMAGTWTAGVHLTPPTIIENLSLSLTYFDIDYEGRIYNPGFSAIFLTQEAQFASLITRNPTQEQIDAVCTKPPLLWRGLQPTDRCNSLSSGFAISTASRRGAWMRCWTIL